MAKTATQSKTLWFNYLGIALETVAFILGKNILPISPAIQASILLAVNGLINAKLRYMTSESIEKKTKEN